MSRRSRPSHDQSVFHEQMDGGGHATSDALADEPALRGVTSAPAVQESAEHNVWDEPVTQAAGIQAPDGAATYAAWSSPQSLPTA